MTNRRRRIVITLAVAATVAVALYAATIARFGAMAGG